MRVFVIHFGDGFSHRLPFQIDAVGVVDDAVENSIGEAREIIEKWRIDYNTERPHSSLKYQTPEEFAAARPFDKTQWAQPLELTDGSAPAPIAQARRIMAPKRRTSSTYEWP